MLFSQSGAVCAEPSASTSDLASFLKAVRTHLGMEVAFVSQFAETHRVLTHLDTSAADLAIYQGQSLPLNAGYCLKVVSGELPELIPDTSLLPEAMAIPETSSLPIGSHLSVPIRLTDGSVYGTLCCFSSVPDPSLGNRDLQTLKVVADVVASRVWTELSVARERDRLHRVIEKALRSGLPKIVYQPVVALDTMRVAGVEALSRFPVDPPRSPDLWFTEASGVGRRAELEIRAITNALQGFSPYWERGWHLAVNVSAQTVLDGFLDEVVRSSGKFERMVLEITEHEHIEDYDALARALAPLRSKGLKVAVDDAGSGYASLRHVLYIRPDIVKMDMSLTQKVDVDEMHEAMVAAIVAFSVRSRSTVVAEGVETQSQLAALCRLGVHMGQGYLLGRPVPPDVLDRAR